MLNQQQTLGITAPQQQISYSLKLTVEALLPFLNMASKGSAGKFKGTLKYSARRDRSLDMYMNLFGTRPGGLLPAAKDNHTSKV